MSIYICISLLINSDTKSESVIGVQEVSVYILFWNRLVLHLRKEGTSSFFEKVPSHSISSLLDLNENEGRIFIISG
jgi:hypothetical protein